MTTAHQARNSHFQHGSGVFACECCTRQTRHTGVQPIGTKICEECYELAGFQNMLWDDGVEGFSANDWAEVRRLWAIVQEKGDAAKGIQGIEELIQAIPAEQTEAEETSMTDAVYFGQCAYTNGDDDAQNRVGLAKLSGPDLVKLYNEVAETLDRGEVKRFSDTKAAVRRTWLILQDYAQLKPETQMKGSVRAVDAPHPAIKSITSETPAEKKARLAQASADAIRAKPEAPSAADKIIDKMEESAAKVRAQSALRNAPPVTQKDAEMPALRKAAKPLDLAPKKKVYARKAGTKQAILVDLLSRPEGATFGELYDALAATGKPWRGVTIRSGLAWDMNHVTGYGIRSEMLNGEQFDQQGRTYEAERLGVTSSGGGREFSPGYDPELKLAVYFLTYPDGMDGPIPHMPRAADKAKA